MYIIPLPLRHVRPRTLYRLAQLRLRPSGRRRTQTDRSHMAECSGSPYASATQLVPVTLYGVAVAFAFCPTSPRFFCFAHAFGSALAFLIFSRQGVWGR